MRNEIPLATLNTKARFADVFTEMLARPVEPSFDNFQSDIYACHSVVVTYTCDRDGNIDPNSIQLIKNLPNGDYIDFFIEEDGGGYLSYGTLSILQSKKTGELEESVNFTPSAPIPTAEQMNIVDLLFPKNRD
jgi:hypothetical protein